MQNDAVFFADFVFYVENAGDYEIWYGGTPAGPKDELFPSYSSPFSYMIDGKIAHPVYRENIKVVENYAPAYYWCLVEGVNLTSGQHTIRYEVKDKRRFDGKYYFYMDCFFLVKKQGATRQIGSPRPAVFPKNLDDRRIDYPFKSLEEYLIVIRDNPTKIDAYMELAMIYSFLGDYLNAIKYLKRAELYDPKNPDIMLLMAKNRIWRGDIAEGLDIYRQLLAQQPDRIEVWIEAGKMASWSGMFTEAEQFIKSALNLYPDDILLTVNLALNYLWASDIRKAGAAFDKAKALAGDDYDKLKNLALAYRVNGYPNEAAAILREIIGRFPQMLETYLLLEDLYNRNGQPEKAKQVKDAVEKIFVSSAKLSSYLELFHVKQGLKETFIAKIEEDLHKQPDNLELRSILAQTYFWNGFRNKAISEYINIIVNYAFASFKEQDENSAYMLQVVDEMYLYLNYLEGIQNKIQNAEKDLLAQYTRVKIAEKNLLAYQQKVQLAEAKGQSVPEPSGQSPEDSYNAEKDKLYTMLATAIMLQGSYDQVVESFQFFSSAVVEFTTQEASEKEVFDAMIKETKWMWYKQDFILELMASSANGQLLADTVLGKIYLIDQMLGAAESYYKKVEDAGIESPDKGYGYFQALLWSGKTSAAFQLIETKHSDLKGSLSYFADLKDIYANLFPAQEGYEVYEDIDGTIKEVTAGFKKMDASVKEQLKQTRDYLAVLHNILKNQMIRAVYRFQENSYLIRNELGDFYLKQKKLDLAIRQFRYVLAINPWDVEAIFKLGQVYEWSGDWREAMRLYRKVYEYDPTNDGALRSYNALARENAPQLEFAAGTLSENSKFTFDLDAAYTTQINTMLSWSLLFFVESVKLYSTTGDPQDYHFYGLGLGFPLSFPQVGLVLYPTVGMHLWNDSEGNLTTPSVGFNNIAFTTQLSFAWNIGESVYLYGLYYFGRQDETFAPDRDELWTHSGQLSVTVKFNFINVPVIENSSIRTYGEFNYISDSNITYSVGQEWLIGVLSIPDPDMIWSLMVRALWEDGIDDASTYSGTLPNYYVAQENLTVGGGLKGRFSFVTGENSGFSTEIVFLASSYNTNILDSALTTKSIKFEALAYLEFVVGTSAFFIDIQFTNTYKYEPIAEWDYFSVSVRLGYTARLPQYLIP